MTQVGGSGYLHLFDPSYYNFGKTFCSKEFSMGCHEDNHAQDNLTAGGYW